MPGLLGTRCLTLASLRVLGTYVWFQAALEPCQGSQLVAEDTITCPALERSSAWQPLDREPAASTRQIQAVTPAYASRAVWIIRVFLFLILESTLSYVRQLEARVRQLEEENRVLPQVGDFCCGNSSRQLDSSAEGLVLNCMSLGAAASERSDWSSGESKTLTSFVRLAWDWVGYLLKAVTVLHAFFSFTGVDNLLRKICWKPLLIDKNWCEGWK